ncbi:MAG: hypothetical protein PHP73_05580 [Candidatus Omnitrophica bacterium]|nr:hypothetical protein [Candidatus Omnitrophota bacterium]
MLENKPHRGKILIFLAIQFFFFFGISLATPTSVVKAINIPSTFGNIKEVFDIQDTKLANTQNPNTNLDKTIIHIQDAHCNYEAQKNMAQLLDYLVKEQNLKLIMVEGGSGNVNLEFLRNYADKKAREGVADKYLKLGKISGEEYLDIVADYPLDLYGIEDEALYEAHLDVFHKVDALRDESLKYLDDLSKVVNALKPKIYSEEVKYLESAKKNYEDKTLSLGEYCGYLKNIAINKGFDLQSYPFLSVFAELARLEKEVDFKQAEAQRNEFIKSLGSLLNEKQVKAVVDKSQDFKAGKINPGEYYSFLKDLAAKKRINLEQNYPQLGAYIRYINENKKIDVAQLLKEVGSLEEKIKEALFANADQKRLYEISKALNVLKGVVSLELTPEDYGYFQANRPDMSTGSWMSFLSVNCAKYKLAVQAPASGIVDENLGKFEEFYKLGADREQAFIKNIVKKMDESGEKIAVFIAGGFHTPGMTQMFKERGYSYAVVTPTITKKTDSSVYLSVLRGEKKNLQSENIDKGNSGTNGSDEE